ncbi:hypothetical protein [Tellurirhabdus rosea]|uniref:hypothetical protein n=1 Tax=Tellurirhabdus rosea TaxID=2674997 RepID=UPI0022553805|nr:hypothetical protein [Tellurirhabdus rosea]
MGKQNPFSSLNVQKIQNANRFKIRYDKVRNLEFIDQDKIRLVDVDAFRKRFPVEWFNYMEIVGQPHPLFPPDIRYYQNYSAAHFPKGKMVVAVHFDLYNALKERLNRYVVDLAYDGYFADVYTIKGGRPLHLRNFLKSYDGLKGALLVGSVAVPWFEMDDDFYGAHAEFPCDLFYMDLTGTWSDTDADGKYSQHTGNVAPEIWIGRLWTPTAGGNDVGLLIDYFDRNHRFRVGQLGHSRSALTLIDDDWEGFGDCGLDGTIPAANIEVITAPASTTGPRYKSEVQDIRGWVQIGAHSNPFGHSFKKPDGSDWVPNTFLRDEKPPKGYFYNLFACSNARYTDAEYMAGWYIFDKAGGGNSNGLVAVGSTKTGSMLYFENFYNPMGAGKNVGDAFVDWWKSIGPDHNLDERRWFYGMVILGDPTLNWWSGVVPQLQTPAPETVFNHFPRNTTYSWTPVNIPGATYTLEIDAFGAVASGKWAAEAGSAFLVRSGITGTSFSQPFVGAQRGRFRVRAQVGGRNFPWSEWSYFRYTV